ncbi:MAG TPA: hypothetical protein VHO25_13220 [Polyangiaceae bacterium]|nr:hypothetical protein [Polyangiaceae bacterium]
MKRLSVFVVEMTNRAWSKARPIDIIQVGCYGRWNSNDPEGTAKFIAHERNAVERRYPSKVRFRARRYRP